MARTIDLESFRPAYSGGATFAPTRAHADRARPSPTPGEAAELAAKVAAQAAEQPSRPERDPGKRAPGRGAVLRFELLVSWLIALALLLGIGAASLATYSGGGRDAAVRAIVRGAPSGHAPAAWSRDDVPGARTRDDE
jgi:hypothetical protein